MVSYGSTTQTSIYQIPHLPFTPTSKSNSQLHQHTNQTASYTNTQIKQPLTPTHKPNSQLHQHTNQTASYTSTQIKQPVTPAHKSNSQLQQHTNQTSVRCGLHWGYFAINCIVRIARLCHNQSNIFHNYPLAELARVSIRVDNVILSERPVSVNGMSTNQPERLQLFHIFTSHQNVEVTRNNKPHSWPIKTMLYWVKTQSPGFKYLCDYVHKFYTLLNSHTQLIHKALNKIWLCATSCQHFWFMNSH